MTFNKEEGEIPKGGGDTHRKSVPLEGECPRNIVPRGRYHDRADFLGHRHTS